MTIRRAVGACVLASVLLALPSMGRVNRVAPLYLSGGVRGASLRAMEALRDQGLWLVNVDLLGVDHRADGVCFTWDHRYSRRRGRDPSEVITTCISQ